MKAFVVLFIIASWTFVNSFTIKQLQESEAYARDCIIKVGINPIAVNRLRKGDFSRNDEKMQVSFFS
jgi:hypothetical protein